MSSISITVRYFAMIRDLMKTSETTLELPTGTTAGEVFGIVTADRPDLTRLQRSMLLMVNQQYADADQVLSEGDELAFIPPVSGGEHKLFTVTTAELDPRAIEQLVASTGAGALVTFVGTVRDNARGRDVTALEYEAYESAAEKMLAQIGDEISERWSGTSVAISHRFGLLKPGVASVVICTASAHRDDAYEANRYAIERIKEIVPIWKKEFYSDGSSWIGSEHDYQVEIGKLTS